MTTVDQGAHAGAGQGDHAARDPIPLGPDSLTWRLFGDSRALLNLLWIGTMQTMHPQLGAAVGQKSTFFDERWQRTLRALYPIEGAVYDGDRAPITAGQVRDYHRGIHGVDSAGRRYNALEPGVFFWAHSTGVMSMVAIARTLGDPLTEQQCEQLWAEGLQWWSLYRMPDPPGGLPATWAEFERHWHRTCETVLEDNATTRRILDLSAMDRPPFLTISERTWRLLRPPVARFVTWITVAMYDPSVRELYGYSWTERDAARLERLRRIMRLLWRVLPARLSMHPRARAAWRRARGGDPAGTPLVHTPDRNLPPEHLRSSPYHYSPPPQGTPQRRRRWRRSA